MSNALQPGSAATANTQLTSTSGTRMSTGADNGGAGRENSSNAFGEQRSSVPVGSSGNGNASSTSSSTSTSSTQTGQAGVRTRIIVDDFIALISNVPASAVAGATAATASAAQPHFPGVGQAAASSVPHMLGVGMSATGTSPNHNPPPPASVSSASGVPNATPGQGQAMPQGIAGGIAMNLVSGLGAASPNHPDPSLPCQSFHFGPPSRRSGSAPQQTSQPSSTTATSTTSAQSRPPRATTASATTTTTTPSATRPSPPVSRPQPPREQPRPQPERRSRGIVPFYKCECISEL